MAEALLLYFRQTLPSEIATIVEPYLARLEKGEYEALLRDPLAQRLFGRGNESSDSSETVESSNSTGWNDYIFNRLGLLLSDRSQPGQQAVFFCIGYAALLLFLQSNVTGPPLAFVPAHVVLPSAIAGNREATRAVQRGLLASLKVDGMAPYRLTPNVELLCLADAVFTCPPILKNTAPARWAKLRVAFLQQRLLAELSSTLQDVIYDDLEILDAELSRSLKPGDGLSEVNLRSEFLLERAVVHLHHGLDKFARQDLDLTRDGQGFEYALTGRLGKRTKFQQTDVTQLVVLARNSAAEAGGDGKEGHGANGDHVKKAAQEGFQPVAKPKTLDLDDDTLLESISFTPESTDTTKILDSSDLPPSLAALDPSNQPQLRPLDATILLLFASSITNTSPADGLTREETLPYANRVLEAGSSNWQVYTHALLLRSRIEGYKSRTVERGLLQLQALVDQVIAETASPGTAGKDDSNANTGAGGSSTFLPRAKESESAPAGERLRYIFQLASPTRWEMEAELASRWVSLGGLKSALDIYERLEMWAEAALCWAATEHEDKARKIVRRQLFHATGQQSNAKTEQERELEAEGEDEAETWSGAARDPPPADAPRLYCILGDIDQSPEMYKTAWEVSGQRYARAQRSLGRLYFTARDFLRAAEAYSKSLKANQLNQNSWFALGCALLELAQFEKAAEAFSRCVQLDESDAESWSNLAAALLRRDPQDENGDEERKGIKRVDEIADDEEEVTVEKVSDGKEAAQQNRQDALKALKRAAALKHDSYRIWENVLVVSASVSPPDFTSILSAQTHIVSLRGAVDGEKCVDVEIFDLLVRHVISLGDAYEPSKPGIQRMAVRFVDEQLVPLITNSADLWRTVSRLALWRKKPLAALEAEEKAWRAVTSAPGWETDSERRWEEVVEATVRLCDSYENFGPQQRTEGMGAGTPVAKDWKFKARSAVRGIMGRGKASWEGTEGWQRLKDVMHGL